MGITVISLGFFENDSAQIKQEAYHGYTIWAIALIPRLMKYSFLTSMRIVFVRIAVSMLPDDDEPLVPLDDSLKRIRRMGVSDAWKSSVCTYVRGSGEFMAGHLLQELSFSSWGKCAFRTFTNMLPFALFGSIHDCTLSCVYAGTAVLVLRLAWSANKGMF